MDKILEIIKNPPVILLTLGGLMVLASLFQFEKLPGPMDVREPPALLSMIIGILLLLTGIWLYTRKTHEAQKQPPKDSTSINIEGLWKSHYEYVDTGGEPYTIDEKMNFTQDGNQVIGKNKGDPDGLEYELRGEIGHSIFMTGTWRELGDRTTNHGVFQLKISTHGKKMEGMWLGIPDDDKGDITPGRWSLDLESSHG